MLFRSVVLRIHGAIAQLVEHLHGMQGVRSSSLLGSIASPFHSLSCKEFFCGRRCHSATAQAWLAVWASGPGDADSSHNRPRKRSSRCVMPPCPGGSIALGSSASRQHPTASSPPGLPPACVVPAPVPHCHGVARTAGWPRPCWLRWPQRCSRVWRSPRLRCIGRVRSPACDSWLLGWCLVRPSRRLLC